MGNRIKKMVSTENSIPDEIKSIRLPEGMKDLSYDTCNKDKEFLLYSKLFQINKDNFQDFKPITFQKEFEYLKDIVDYDSKHESELSTNNGYRDRYSDIKPYTFNTLKIQGKNYINASFINGPLKSQERLFIATQGPLDATNIDFWEMIIENNTMLIIMLCNLQEGGRPKCHKYWPDKNKSTKAKDFSVSYDGNENFLTKTLIERKFNLKLKNEERVITQLHYIGWPDHGIPEVKDDDITFDIILDYIDNFFNVWEEDKQKSPIVVHCSAGVGRTGTLISLYNCYSSIKYQAIQAKKNNQELEFNLSVWNTVRKCKEQRIMLCENINQYQFLWINVIKLVKGYFK